MKVCCYFHLFQRSRCDILLSSIIICNAVIVNCEFVDTSHKYLENTWFLSGFKIGVGNSSVSRGNLNSLQTDATPSITLVSSIGDMFHTYWYVFKSLINISWLTRYCPEIACVFKVTGDSFQRYLLYGCYMLKVRILFEGTYKLLQSRLWICCLSLLIPLLTSKIITQLLP